MSRRLAEVLVRVSKEVAAANRARILAEAARLFRERGLDGVGVDALTEAAGLSHGSLYSQFGSKERLAVAALEYALGMSAARLGGAGTLEDYVVRYLTPAHRDDRGDGCAIAALAGEMPRQRGGIRAGFTEGVRGVARRVAQLLPGRAAPEDEALAVLATMVGALTLARAVDDPGLADRILAAARARLADG